MSEYINNKIEYINNRLMWCEEEINYILQNINIKTYKELSKDILELYQKDRSVDSIKKKIRRLGLKKYNIDNKDNKWIK